ncbi:MAG: hypothetical protein JNL62_02410 [Bryobacterales bacterium]|nr:hypothetical protein [Bryobacterales bacterium]
MIDTLDYVRSGQPWEIDRNALARLLAALDPDPARAALCYEELRQKLIRFFEWERSEIPDRDADEALNRVARRLAEGVEMKSPGAFAYGIARYILREQAAEAKRKERAMAELAAQPRKEAHPEGEAMQDCLEQCLASFPPEARWLLEKYYSGQDHERIPNRRALAEELRLGSNALRNRVLRLRVRLESCTADCMKKSDGNAIFPTHNREA